MKPFPKLCPSFAIDPLGAGGMLQPVAEPRVDNRPRLDEERGRPSEYPEKPAERQQIRRPLLKLGCRGHAPSRISPNQVPPGLGLKNLSCLSGTSFHSSASAGYGFLRVILGQVAADLRLSSSQRSAGGSLSGMIASTGHSGSHTPQSMHSSGWMTSMFSPS